MSSKKNKSRKTVGSEDKIDSENQELLLEEFDSSGKNKSKNSNFTRKAGSI